MFWDEDFKVRNTVKTVDFRHTFTVILLKVT